VFRESNELRLFDFKSKVMMLAVSAMRSIGEDRLRDATLTVLRMIVRNVPPEIYQNDIRLAPVWVRKKLEK